MVHLENFVGRYQERDTSRNLEELVFLKDWFLAHIEEFDRKYAEF
jgi:hemerythrin